MYRSNKRSIVFIFLVPCLIIFFSGSAFSAERPIAKLTSFSGTVLIKSQNTWGVKPEVNLPLYSEDRVVTRVGNAIVTFNDGATLEIQNNSNVLIVEKVEEKGILKKVKVVERRVLLFLGKLMFKTGKEKVETRFETGTAVIGIRGTAGILSIGPEGMTYIYFTEGGAAYIIGDFIAGVAVEVPPELADQNALQRATFVANAAADQQRRTQAKFDAGLTSEAQVALASAIADEASAREFLIQGESLLTSPDAEVVKQATQQIIEARKAVEEAKQAQQKAIEDGADPAFRIFTPGDPGFDVPVGPSSPKPES